MKPKTVREVLLIIGATVTALTLYEFFVKPAVTKMTTPPQQRLATSSIQR